MTFIKVFMLADSLASTQLIDGKYLISPPYYTVIFVIWYQSFGPLDIVLHWLFIFKVDYDIFALFIHTCCELWWVSTFVLEIEN